MGVKERYDNRKKTTKEKDENKSAIGVAERYEMNKFSTSLPERLENLTSTRDALYKDYTSRFTDKDGNYINAYRGDTKDALTSFETSKANIDNESKAILDGLSKYGQYLGADKIKGIQDYLSSYSGDLENMYKTYQSDYDYYSQWKDEDAYNRDIDNDTYSKKYAKATYADLQKAKADIEKKLSENKADEALNRELYWLQNHDTDVQYVDTMSNEELENLKKANEEKRNEANAKYNLAKHNLDALNQNNIVGRAVAEAIDYFSDDYKNPYNTAQSEFGKASAEKEKTETENGTVLYYDDDGVGVTVDDILKEREYTNTLNVIESDEDTKTAYDKAVEAQANIDKLSERQTELLKIQTQNSRVGASSDAVDAELMSISEAINKNRAIIDEFDSLGYNFSDMTYYANAKKSREEYAAKVAENEEYATGHPVKATLKSIASSPASAFELAGNLIDSAQYGYSNVYDDDYILRNQTYQSTVADMIGTKVTEKTDNEILSWLASSAYSGVTSSVQSALTTGACTLMFGGAGAPVALAVMGTEAAASSYNNAIMNGSTNGEAILTAVSSGIAEAAFEKISLDKLIDIGKMYDVSSMSALIKSMIKNSGATFVQGGVEASEEFFTEIADKLADEIINGDHSAYNSAVAKYKKMGYSDTDAKQIASKDAINEVLEALYGGFIGGVGAGAGASAVQGTRATATVADNAIKSNKYYNQQGQNIIDQGNLSKLVKDTESLGNERTLKPLKDLANQVSGVKTEELDAKGSKKYAHQVGKLFKGVQEAQFKSLSKTSETAFKNVIKEELEASGADNVEATADILVKAMYGKGLTRAENKQLQSVNGHDIITKALNSAEFTEKLTVEQERQFTENIDKYVDTNMLSKDLSSNKKAEVLDISGYNISTDGKINVDATDEEVSIKSIDSFDNGDVSVKLDTGDVIAATELRMDSNTAVIINGLKELQAEGMIDVPTANYIMAIDYNKLGIKADNFILGAMDSIRYGSIGYESVLGKDEFTRLLPEEIRNDLFEKGKKFSEEKAERKAEALEKQRQERINSGKGKARTSGNVKFDGVKYKDLNNSQKAQVDFLEVVFSEMGINLEFFASPVVNGKHTGENGSYNPKTNTIRIDVFAGNNGEGLMLYTASHELTHFIREWSPAKFKVFADFLIERYGEKNIPLKTLINAKIDNANVKGRTMSFDQAYEEVVSDACESFLRDSNAKDALVALAQVDESLPEKIIRWIKDFAKLIENAINVLNGKNPESKESRYVLNELKGDLSKLHDLWDEALLDARENAQWVESSKTAQKNTTDEGDAKYAERDFPIDNDIQNIVSDALSKNKKSEMHILGSISNAENNRINKLSNIARNDDYRGKFTGGNHRFSDNAIRHMLSEHGNFLREALRAQLPITEDDIARTLSAIKDGVLNKKMTPTKTREGLPSILSSFEINGYTLYAEEITKPLGKNLPNDLVGHTMYKAPTLPTAAGVTTSVKPLPRRQSEVLCNYYMSKNSKKSSGNFIADTNNEPALLNFLVDDSNNAVSDGVVGGLIPLSSNASNLNGKTSKGYVRCKKPFIITDGNRVFDNSEDNVAEKVNNLKKQGYDCFIFDYKTGDNYFIAVTNKAQIIKPSNMLFQDRNDNRNTDLYSRISEMQLEVNKLRRSMADIESSEEFKEEQRKLSEAFSKDVDSGIELYKKWLEESEYSKLKSKKDALEEELDKLRTERDNEISSKALEKEKNAIAKSGLSEADYFRKQAVKEFGYTPYFYDAGYIIPNGKMLNFSGEKGKHYGSRGQDHRAIGVIYEETEGTDALNRFVKDGNIRIMAESPGIYISTAAEPTKEQYSTVNKFISEYANKEFFNVDFTDENGKVIGSLQYEGRINSARIINDIKHYYAKGEIREQSSIDKFLYSDRVAVNQSMTMDEAKQMIQRAFVLGNIYEWYDGEYKNGDEWLREQGVDEVALNIENEYALQQKYLDKIQGVLDGDFYVNDILEAYLNGTLVGKEKPKAKRLDTSVNHRVNDTRFYSPQRIEDVKRLFEVAEQKLTNKNRDEVSKARAKILLFAHNPGASEFLGLSQAELNKKLRSWSGYSAGAREISQRLNNGVADSNKWTGIENCSWLYRSQVTTEELESLVNNLEGAADDYEKLYIARTMLALDTHIDWSWLNIKFDTYERVNASSTDKQCNGYYRNDARLIHVKHNAPNTVAHEMGHALDYQWARDLGYSHTALTEVSATTERITDADTRQFFDNFKIFMDSLTDNGDIRSEYTQNPKEVFARFVARFIQWVDNTATGRKDYSYELYSYNDKFTASNYIEFVKLLQEKAMLDAKKMREDVKFQDRDSEGDTLTKEQIEFFKDSKVRDENGNLFVCYHGTDAEFNTFDADFISQDNKLGLGFYFKMGERLQYSYEHPKTVYLNITNPITDTSKLLSKEAVTKLCKKLNIELDYDSSDFDLDVYERLSYSFNGKTKEFLDNVVNILGVDGIISKDRNTVVAFKPNQIKNIDNPNPTESDDIRYQDRPISDREILVDAMSNIEELSVEDQNRLKTYKVKIDNINELEKELADVGKQIHKIITTKGSDRKQMAELNAKADTLRKKISRADGELLRIEAMEPIQKLVEIRKKQALKAYKQKAQEQRHKSVEGRNKTATKNKIKKVIKTLESLYSNPTKEKNVKIEFQDMVKKALVMADALFDDGNISSSDILSGNLTIRLGENERKKLDEWRKVYKRRQDYRDKLDALESSGKVNQKTHDELLDMINRCNNKLNRLGRDLSDVVERQKAELNEESLKNAIDSLVEAYKSLEDSTEGYAKAAYNDYVAKRLDTLKAALKNTTAKTMTLTQLEELYQAYKMVLTTVRTANELFVNNKKMSVEDMGEKVISEVKMVVNPTDSKIADLKGIREFSWEELKPVYAFERIGSKTFMQLYKEVLIGQSVIAQDVAEAQAFFRKMNETYGYDSWDLKETKDFKLADGRIFSINLEEIMSIYAYSKREQALDHITEGGFVFDNKKFFTDTKEKGVKGKIKKQRTTVKAYRINDDMFYKIINSLTKEQKKFIDDMQEYLSAAMGAKGNEVSRVLYGIDLFKEKHYFPLMSSEAFINQTNEPVKTVTLKNSGMTKATVPHAMNPIVLQGFMDVWSNHVNKMSTYHGLVLPIENLNKVFNYTGYAHEDESVSVETILSGAYGDEVNRYITNFITDLNGGIKTQSSGNWVTKGISLFKKTAVAASTSVVVQQPTAIVRAMAMIKPKYFVHGTDGMKHNEAWEELKKYAPIAVVKEMGGFDVGSGRQVADYITAKEYKGKDKVKGFFTDSDYRDDALMWGATKADEIGWITIWNAVKKEIADTTTYKEGSDEFLKACGERFTEVIDYTQVYDSVLSRSGFMRNKGEISKMATSFMGEPTTSFNMLYNAILQAKRGNIGKGEMAKIMGATISSIILASIAKSLIYALRDDDEDESYAEKYAQSLTNGLMEDLFIPNMLPYVNDITSLFSGWDVERTDMAILKDFKDAVDGLDSSSKSLYRKIEDLAGAVAAFGGIPLKNVMRTVREMYNLMANVLDDNSPSASDVGDAIAETVVGETSSSDINEALEKGKTDKVKKIINDLVAEKVEQGKTEKEAKASIKASVTSYWKELYLQAYRDKDNAEMLRIRQILQSTGLYDNVVETCSNWIKSMKDETTNTTYKKW